MASFTILSTVNTLDSKRKAAEWLKEKEYDTLFLDFPMEIEGFIKDIALGADSEHILKHLKDLELIKGPEDERIYRVSRPLLDLVSENGGSNVEVYCYLDPLSGSFDHEVASVIMALTARAKLGKVDLGEWRDLLRDQVQLEIKCADREGRYLDKRAKEVNMCLDASNEVKTYLRNLGYDVSEVSIDKSCKPLDILRGKVKEEFTKGVKVPDEEFSHFINDHLTFTELIIEKNYEEAYKIWKESHIHFS